LSWFTEILIALFPLNVHGPRQLASLDNVPSWCRRQSRAIGEPVSSSCRICAASAESAVCAGSNTKARSFE
jgi:hypothetical protein